MRFTPSLTAYVLGSAALLAIGAPVTAQHRSPRPSERAQQRIDKNDSIWFVAQVKDLDAQSPIANARVEINGQPAHIRTNHAGKFYVRGTRGSKHSISIRAVGYAPHTFDLTDPGTWSEPMDVWMVRASGQSKSPHMRGLGERKAGGKKN